MYRCQKRNRPLFGFLCGGNIKRILPLYKFKKESMVNSSKCTMLFMHYFFPCVCDGCFEPHYIYSGIYIRGTAGNAVSCLCIRGDSSFSRCDFGWRVPQVVELEVGPGNMGETQRQLSQTPVGYESVFNFSSWTRGLLSAQKADFCNYGTEPWSVCAESERQRNGFPEECDRDKRKLQWEMKYDLFFRGCNEKEGISGGWTDSVKDQPRWIFKSTLFCEALRLRIKIKRCRLFSVLFWHNKKASCLLPVWQPFRAALLANGRIWRHPWLTVWSLGGTTSFESIGASGVLPAWVRMLPSGACAHPRDWCLEDAINTMIRIKTFLLKFFTIGPAVREQRKWNFQ